MEAEKRMMKAAVVTEPGKPPVYTDFPRPETVAPSNSDGDTATTTTRYLVTVNVRAAALTHLTKAKASGTHYSSGSVSQQFVPGIDGVGRTADDGRRVYFLFPRQPYGAMCEVTQVWSDMLLDLPEEVDDVTAAAVANPGMSAWAALVARAQLQPGETVLINGATGSGGRIAIQAAKRLGAKRVIATGRDKATLEGLKLLGADVIIPFDPEATKEMENAVIHEIQSEGVDVVLDYLWGPSAQAIIMAIAKATPPQQQQNPEAIAPIRFVQIGSVSGADILLPGAALRSSSIVMMGSGLKSLSQSALLNAIRQTFASHAVARLQIPTRSVPLSEVSETWDHAESKERTVYVVARQQE